MKKILLIAILFTWSLMMFADTKQDATKWNTPQAGNPFIPGYFADPTIKKFGDTYYLYATTDGTGNGYGPAQVWVSKDFRNWTNSTFRPFPAALTAIPAQAVVFPFPSPQ